MVLSIKKREGDKREGNRRSQKRKAINSLKKLKNGESTEEKGMERYGWIESIRNEAPQDGATGDH
jgi:hypothetical protein